MNKNTLRLVQKMFPWVTEEARDETELWNALAECFQEVLESDNHAWKSDSWQEGMDYFPYSEWPISAVEVPYDFQEDMERAFENAREYHLEYRRVEEVADEEDWESMDYEEEFE